MKRSFTLFILSLLIFSTELFSQSVTIGVGQFTSTTNLYGPMRSTASATQYNRHAYIYPASLLGPLSHGDVITSVAFERTGTAAMSGNPNFKIYIGNHVDSDWGSGSILWDTTAASYTLVYDTDPTAAVGASAGLREFNFTTPYSWDTTKGTNLVVLVEYIQATAQTASILWTYDNAAGVPGYAANQTKYAGGTSATPSNTLSSSNERHPKIKVNFPKPNDAEVNLVYTLGKLPIPFGNPHVVSALVSNAGTNSLTNLNVSLNISGANVFADVQTIASLAPGASTLVSFSGFSPTNLGANTVTVSVPNDDVNSNNSASAALETNPNAVTYAQGTVPSGGVGFTGATGDFVAKFAVNSQQLLNRVDVVFSTGGQPFQIGVWDAAGAGGTPGTNLYSGDTLTSSSGSFTVLLSPGVTIPAGSFYVGVKQIATTNVSFGFESESPIRSSAFFYTSPTGSSTWTDFASGNLGFRIMIEPTFALANDVAVTSIDQSGETYYPGSTSSLPMTGEVANLGISSATFTVTRTIWEGLTQVYTNTQSVSNLAASTTANVTFAPFTNYVSGTEYTIKDTAAFSGDQDLSNNVMTTSYTPFIAKPLVFVFSSATANERSNRDSVFNALNAINISYDTLNRDNGLVDLSIWRTVIWGEEGSISEAERNALMAFLDSGTVNMQRSLLIAGDDIGYFHGRSGSSTLDTNFYWNYLHAEYFLDDGNGSADQSRICGVNINQNLCDSLDSSFPDGIGVLNGSQVGYRFDDLPANSDTVVSVVFDGTTYNVVYHAFEFREIVTDVTRGVNQIMQGSLDWIVNAGGAIPVELVSLSVSVNENNVALNWVTATETNNKGFAVERKADGNDFSEIAFIGGAGTSTERNTYSYTDKKLDAGKYTYRLKQVDFDGTVSYSDKVEVDVAVPSVFTLEQNYPNPFNPATTIKYSVPKESFVNLSIYNALGERVAQLVNETNKAGFYEVNFRATQFASGVYFYRLEAGDFVSIKKMMLLK